MVKFLGNIITLLIEIVGLVGGLLWANSTNWDHEPVILLIVSILGIISYFLVKTHNKNLRPYIDFELKRGSSMQYAPKFIYESPKKDGHFTDFRSDGMYLFEFLINYKIIIRNNSNQIAYNPRIFMNSKELLYSSSQDNYSNPISIATPKILDLSLNLSKKMIHSESNRVLQKANPPEIIKNLIIIATYQNEEREIFCSTFTIKDGNRYYNKIEIPDDYIEMKY